MHTRTSVSRVCLGHLGYAVTTHCVKASRRPVHVLVEPTTTWENLYVSITRGRGSNQATSTAPDDHNLDAFLPRLVTALNPAMPTTSPLSSTTVQQDQTDSQATTTHRRPIPQAHGLPTPRCERLSTRRERN